VIEAEGGRDAQGLDAKRESLPLEAGARPSIAMRPDSRQKQTFANSPARSARNFRGDQLERQVRLKGIL
jgi:hypothetical protein